MKISISFPWLIVASVLLIGLGVGNLCLIDDLTGKTKHVELLEKALDSMTKMEAISRANFAKAILENQDRYTLTDELRDNILKWRTAIP